MNIDVFSRYKVIEIINDTYKSYDSDDDNWFKNDEYKNELELDGIEIINRIIRLLDKPDFIDITISSGIDNHIVIDIQHFDALSGEGTEWRYIIERKEIDGNE